MRLLGSAVVVVLGLSVLVAGCGDRTGLEWEFVHEGDGVDTSDDDGGTSALPSEEDAGVFDEDSGTQHDDASDDGGDFADGGGGVGGSDDGGGGGSQGGPKVNCPAHFPHYLDINGSWLCCSGSGSNDGPTGSCIDVSQ